MKPKMATNRIAAIISKKSASTVSLLRYVGLNPRERERERESGDKRESNGP